jgi:O-succinylbenzoate synthase
MQIDQIDLSLVRLPLVRPFQTSSSRKVHLDHILVRALTSDGGIGWGECASPSDPFYCPETVETCWHILRDFLAPMVLGRQWSSIKELTGFYGQLKGNAFARAGLEMACWDALARSQGRPLHTLLGGTRREILSGVSLGIEEKIDHLLSRIDQFVEEGYRRVKLKIGPGWDVDVVRRVRQQHPSLPLQVDANSAYSLADSPRLLELDEFNLVLIEQPLGHDDIIDHARLQAKLKTPICLDESIHSGEDARKALDLGACRVINIKVSRLGGLLEAKRVHDLCYARGVPVWCGGMHEFGIGRAANVAIASLPGFTLPGDISGSDKYYHHDIAHPPILASRGAITVPDAPGLGVSPITERIKEGEIRSLSLRAQGSMG